MMAAERRWRLALGAAFLLLCAELRWGLHRSLPNPLAPKSCRGLHLAERVGWFNMTGAEGFNARTICQGAVWEPFVLDAFEQHLYGQARPPALSLPLPLPALPDLNRRWSPRRGRRWTLACGWATTLSLSPSSPPLIEYCRSRRMRGPRRGRRRICGTTTPGTSSWSARVRLQTVIWHVGGSADGVAEGQGSGEASS